MSAPFSAADRTRSPLKNIRTHLTGGFFRAFSQPVDRGVCVVSEPSFAATWRGPETTHDGPQPARKEQGSFSRLTEAEQRRPIPRHQPH